VKDDLVLEVSEGKVENLHKKNRQEARIFTGHFRFSMDCQWSRIFVGLRSF
jgi:hypothetical protein